ncbi:MAG: Gfo/Idh/MocA family oxidoreductase, partial [Butyrivibrio sp.]|nr:Gfo/Idh/MocA family oxidoreductase [Butyrivibrio sp.]
DERANEEILKLKERVEKVSSQDSLNIVVLADTHATVNGTWDNTMSHMKKFVATGARLDKFVHLGDLTDGMVQKAATEYYNQNMINDMKSLGIPFRMLVGNHDSNYFRNNPEPFEHKELERLYMPRDAKEVHRKRGKLYYYEDHTDKGIRCIYLDSFDYREKVRYGYSEEELEWLEKVLLKTPNKLCVVVFSHVPPTPRLHYWSKEMRGSKRLVRILQRYQYRSQGKLLGFIHGHNHGDQVFEEYGFPVISMGCNKCEECRDIKPEGCETAERALGEVSEDLWDVLVINASERTIDCVRYGAGSDRHIDATASYKRKEPKEYMTKVITYGTFDLFHEGHYKLLQRAKALGDYLIVGVTTEHFDQARGKVNVVDSIMTRIENVKKTGFADEIIVEDHEGQKIEDIQKYGIDIFTEGSDWTGYFDYLNAFCKVIYLDRTPDISSTLIRGDRFKLIRVGIVGTGRIAPRFVRESRYVSGLIVSCAFNPIKNGDNRFQREDEIRVYRKSYEEFLKHVDAVYIASPHETHYEYAKMAILAHKHVLCEKPMTFTYGEAVELYILAGKENVVLMEGIKAAYCPGFQQLINVAVSGAIGEIRDVEACFSRIADADSREMTDDKYGGAFLEFGGYPLLPIFKIFGTNYEKMNIESIEAESGIDLYTKISFKYKNGLAMAKTGVGVKSEGQLIIAGTKGYVIAESPWWLTRKFEVRYEDPNRIEHYEPKFLGDGLRYEISEFIKRINGTSDMVYRLTADESIAMARVVEEFMKIRNSKEK